jgi:hypothetical protein
LSVPLAGDIAGTDWALLLDLKLEGEIESSGQVELGITANVERSSRRENDPGQDRRRLGPLESSRVPARVVVRGFKVVWLGAWHRAMTINTKEASNIEPDIAP